MAGHRLIQRRGALLGDHANNVAFGKDAEHAHRGIGDHDRANALRGKKFDHLPESSMRLGGKDLAPLFGKNARNCHILSPWSDDLVPAAADPVGCARPVVGSSPFPTVSGQLPKSSAWRSRAMIRTIANLKQPHTRLPSREKSVPVNSTDHTESDSR